MKKLMMILASVTLTTPILGTAVACHKTDKAFQVDVPTVGAIKASLKKQGYNIDDLDVDLAPGMKSATIRFMSDAPNRPFLAKKIDIKGASNNINKIITFTSMPYDESFEDKKTGEKLKPETVLAGINKLNGTNFTAADLNVEVDENSKNSVITPKPGGSFIGKEINIINEPIEFPDAFPLQNIGDIYINAELWEEYKKDNVGTISNMIAVIMEFVGDRNRFASLYKQTMLNAIMGIINRGRKGCYIKDWSQ